MDEESPEDLRTAQQPLETWIFFEEGIALATDVPDVPGPMGPTGTGKYGTNYWWLSHLWKMMEWKSVGMMTFQTTNQIIVLIWFKLCQINKSRDQETRTDAILFNHHFFQNSI